MDVGGLFTLLDEAGLAPTPLEVAEAVWLAGVIRASPGQAAAEAEEEAEPEASFTGTPAHGSPVPSDRRPPDDARAAGGGPRVQLYRPVPSGSPQAGREGRGSRTIRVPSATALPGGQALLRSLRPLRRRAPDSRGHVLDEVATASASAETGSVVPVMRDHEERALSLALVIETGPAMAVWAKLESELTALFHQLGAFRDLQKWYLRTAQGKVLGVSRSRREDPRGPLSPGLRDCAELLDPAAERLILFLTDGAGQAWYTGAMAEVLRTWGYSSPVAVLQPLPQQLWARTGLAPVQGRLSAPCPAAPNSRLEFRPHRGPFGPVNGNREGPGEDPDPESGTPAPVPVPVLGLGPEWLGGWARFIDGQGTSGLDCTVTLASTAAPPQAYPAPDPSSSPAERVRRFAEQASPQALRLAVCLSATELSLPIMRQVQAAMLPGTGPAHLAEVLLGGLLSTADAVQNPDAPEEWRYEFAEGVREVLYSALGRSQARRIIRVVSRELTARFGVGADEFTAALAATPATATATLPMAVRPFAEIAGQVIERVTGEFSQGQAAAAPDAPSPGDPGEQAATLIRRYQRAGRIADLDQAIRLLDGSSPESSPGSGSSSPEESTRRGLSLATALRLRYSGTGQRSDLDEAADVLRDVLAAAPHGPQRARLLFEQSTVYGLRYALTGNIGELDGAIAAVRAAAEESAGSDANRSGYDGALGAFLLRRARATENPDDLGEAIDRLRLAVAQPLGLADRARIRTALAMALRRQAAFLTDPSAAVRDLEEAIDVMAEVLELTPDNSGDLAARRIERAAAVMGKASITGNETDLRAAAAAYRQAAEEPSASPEEVAESRAGLGVALCGLARRGDSGVLPEAVRSLRVAVAETPENHKARPSRLASLAAALMLRFARDAGHAQLTEAAHLLTLAADAAPPGSQDRSRYLNELGTVYQRRYDLTHHEPDLFLARETFAKAEAIRRG